MRRFVMATVALSLSVGAGAAMAAEETALPSGAFSPAGSFHDFTRDGSTPVLLSDGRVLILGGDVKTVEVWDPGTFTFRPAGALPKARWGYSATALPDGRVLVVGGVGRGQRADAGAKIWDPTTESFSAAGNLGHARERHTALLLPDGRVLITGGNCDDTQADCVSAEVWDPRKGRFSPAGELAEMRGQFTTTLLADGRVLIVGGSGTEDRTATAEIWDPATNGFSPAGSMAEGRAWHSATLLPDDRVLVVGGGTASAEIWDPAAMSFGPAGALTDERDGYTATLLQDGRVLVVGGEGACDEETMECEVVSEAEIWDPATMSFGPAGELSDGRVGHTAVLLPDGRVLVFGGIDNRDYSHPATAEIWDPAMNAFSPAGAFALAGEDHGHVLLPDGRVLVTARSSEIWDPVLSEPGPPVAATAMDRDDAEARLLSGIRASIRDACKPLRKGLPGAALAAMDCPLADPVVKRVRAYLFREQSDLVDAYFARLADMGLDRDKPHRGRCRPGRPSDEPYHPTMPKERADYPYRSGCFIDGAGRAHFLVTSPPYVLSEVTGRDGDFDAVKGWAWSGNQDVPGGPTVAG